MIEYIGGVLFALGNFGFMIDFSLKDKHKIPSDSVQTIIEYFCRSDRFRLISERLFGAKFNVASVLSKAFRQVSHTIIFITSFWILGYSLDNQLVMSNPKWGSNLAVVMTLLTTYSLFRIASDIEIRLHGTLSYWEKQCHQYRVHNFH
ncbi:hypothetical protein [Haloarcula marismortui]|uniref:Uncharacterized protein n=1 Tax=Haloarcula marismortui ATCC 33800 TaxID=662476 RepID=A0A8T8KL48_9EURY|nr:hypothetical protein [Haloarcula sinaiiensis]QUJ75001.1 hypothetical protein KDQ40_22395 [Haloarcula sinaiiensis ATCC 33800]